MTKQEGFNRPSCFSLRSVILEDKEFFALYSENCIKCSHLTETGTREFEDCHFSKGNKQCPAAEVRIVVVGEALKYARMVIRARDKRLAKKEARLMAHVGKQSAAFKSRFYEYLENGGKLTISKE